MNVGRRLRSGTGGQRVLGVVQHPDLDAKLLFQSLLHRIDRAVSGALEVFLDAVIGVGNLRQRVNAPSGVSVSVMTHFLKCIGSLRSV